VLRSIFAAGAAIALLSTQALADDAGASAASPSRATLSLLSGFYIFTSQRICQPQLTVSYDSNGVSAVSIGSSATSLQEGTYHFVQGTTPGSGTVTVGGIDDYASPVLVTNAGTPGTSGTPMTQQANKGSLAFSQTASTISIMDGNTPSGSTFNVYSGKTLKGIIQSAVYGGIDDGGCAQQGSISLK
jgi:hypothetical protein